MYTGKYSGGHAGKGRSSGKVIALTVSALVLCLSMAGGTLAWLAGDTGPVENILTIPGTDIRIEEKFDGSVKKDVQVRNTGDIPVYVRASFVINYQDAQGNIAPVEPTPDHCRFRYPAETDWFPGSDGSFYYRLPLAPTALTGNLVDTVTMAEGVTPPEGYTLHVRVLAQSIQAQGSRDGVPMVEARGWPVTVQSDGTLAPAD